MARHLSTFTRVVYGSGDWSLSSFNTRSSRSSGTSAASSRNSHISRRIPGRTARPCTESASRLTRAPAHRPVPGWLPPPVSPRGCAMLLGVALVVSWARLAARRHRPTEVAAGWGLAALVAWIT